LRSRSYLFLIVVVCLAALSGYMYTLRKPNYGLDVVGGVRLTYQLDYSKLQEGVTKPQAQQRVVTVMEKRALGVFGVAESNVQAKGDDQVVIELPGKITLAEARATMGKTAKLAWYHGRNIKTNQNMARPFTVVDSKDGEDPVVHFMNDAGKEIVPGTPEYDQVIAGFGKPILEGDMIESANMEPNSSGKGFYPSFVFSPTGAKAIENWSRQWYGKEEFLVAVLDGVAISAAPLKRDTILTGGRAFIDGDFDAKYVRNLTELMNSGALPVTLTETSAFTVDPTIGQSALKQIISTGTIAFCVIALFLIVYYVFPGIVALVALGLYVLFTLTAMKWMGATFSLAAIAGFVLSVGMAVDANILVFERFKEEMREGRSLMKAVDLGFNRAFPAILDSNACTIITSVILYRFGTGPVQGFAISLVVGVLISLFTAVVVTRSLLKFLIGAGIGTDPKWYGLGRNWFGESFEATANEKPIKIVEKSKLWFAISAIMIIPGVILLATSGLKLNVDFQGGYEVQVAVKPEETRESLEKGLADAGYKDASVKFAQTTNEKNEEVRLALVTIPANDEKISSSRDTAQADIAKAVGHPESDVSGFKEISGTVRNETVRNAFLSVVYSSIFIILWLAIRFGLQIGGFVMGMRFAVSVVLALLHDAVFVMGLAAIVGILAGWEVSALFISAMLTVIGFSTHDSIVIFDRIRENLHHPLPGEDMKNLVNRSVTQSIARSLNTAFTVIITLLLLIFMGSATPDLKFFNVTMLAGIIAGTYSSIFNAAPILYLWDKAVIKRKGEAGSMIAIAKQATAERARQALRTQVDANDATQSYGTVKRRRANDYSRRIDD
jgi:SecD/SecF fusion protein